MNQENEFETFTSIVKNRRKMFEQNDIVRPAYSKKPSPISKDIKETKFVTTKSEPNRINLNQSSITTTGKPPEIMKPPPKKIEVTKSKIQNLPTLNLQNNHKQVKTNTISETVSPSDNMKSPINKMVQFCEGAVCPPPSTLPKSEKVNQVLNTVNSSSDVLQNSLTRQAEELSPKLWQSNSNKSPLVPPPPPLPTKSETNQDAEFANIPLVPLPPPSTEADILKPNISNKTNLISSTAQTSPVSLSLSSTRSDSTPSDLQPPVTISKALNSIMSRKINFVTATNQKHPVPPPPPSLISEKSKKEISNNMILPSTTLAPPVPPPPSAKGVGITAQDSINNLSQEHPVAHQLSETLGNKLLDTESCNNLIPTIPPPPSSTRNIRQSTHLIGWASNPSNEQKPNIKESNTPMPVENKNKKSLEVSKVPPIVATPPSLESIRKIKENEKDIKPEGNAEGLYDEDDDISNQPWYFDVTKDEATEIMRTCAKKGTYLMRPSQDYQYVLMIRIDSNETKKFKIQRHNDGWILGEPSTKKMTHTSILALMEFYKTNGIKFSKTNIVLKEPVSKK